MPPARHRARVARVLPIRCVIHCVIHCVIRCVIHCGIHCGLPLLALASLSGGVAQAQAQASSASQADALFREGRALLEQRRYQEACRLFERSLELDVSPGTLLNLGNCYEQEGDVARALSTFERARADAERVTDRARRDAWMSAATRNRDSLAARVPVLTLTPSPSARAVASLDGRSLSGLEGPMRLNPGRHHLELHAPGKTAHARDFELAIGQRLQIELPALEDAPGAVPAPTVATLEASAMATGAGAGSPEADAGRGTRVLPWAFLGTAAGLGAVGIVTALVAKSKENQLDESCSQANPEGRRACNDSDLVGVRDSGENWALASYLLWLGGAASATVGVVILATEPGDEHASAHLSAGCLGSGCGLWASGRF